MPAWCDGQESQHHCGKPLLPLVIVGFMFGMFWNIYAMGRYEPAQFDWLHQGGLPLAIGGLLGLAALAAWWHFARKEKQKVANRNANAHAIGSGRRSPQRLT